MVKANHYQIIDYTDDVGLYKKQEQLEGGYNFLRALAAHMKRVPYGQLKQY